MLNEVALIGLELRIKKNTWLTEREKNKIRHIFRKLIANFGFEKSRWWGESAKVIAALDSVGCDFRLSTIRRVAIVACGVCDPDILRPLDPFCDCALRFHLMCR